MDLCSPPQHFSFDYRLVVTAKPHKLLITTYLLGRDNFYTWMILLMSPPCQKPTEYQTNCFTVVDFVRGLKWLMSLCPVWLHILSRQLPVTFRLDQQSILQVKFKRLSCTRSMRHKLLWWNIPNQHNCSASFTHYFTNSAIIRPQLHKHSSVWKARHIFPRSF